MEESNVSFLHLRSAEWYGSRRGKRNLTRHLNQSATHHVGWCKSLIEGKRVVVYLCDQNMEQKQAWRCVPECCYMPKGNTGFSQCHSRLKQNACCSPNRSGKDPSNRWCSGFKCKQVNSSQFLPVAPAGQWMCISAPLGGLEFLVTKQVESCCLVLTAPLCILLPRTWMINGILPTQSKLFTDGIKAEVGKVLVGRLLL